MWVGKILNRSKSGEIFEVDLATFQIGLIEGLPSNLYLGLSTETGRITEAVNELGAVLCRMAFDLKQAAPPDSTRSGERKTGRTLNPAWPTQGNDPHCTWANKRSVQRSA